MYPPIYLGDHLLPPEGYVPEACACWKHSRPFLRMFPKVYISTDFQKGFALQHKVAPGYKQKCWVANNKVGNLIYELAFERPTVNSTGYPLQHKRYTYFNLTESGLETLTLLLGFHFEREDP